MSSIKKSIGSSLASRTTYGFEEEPRYDDMTIEELTECLDSSIRTNKILEMENDMFEHYLSRHDPQSLIAMTHVLDTAKRIQRVASQLIPESSDQNLVESTSGIYSIYEPIPRSPSKLTSSQTLNTLSGSGQFSSKLIPHVKRLRITLTRRAEMATEETEETKKNMLALEKETMKKKESIQAQMEEIQTRIQDIHETKNHLEENIVKKGVDPLTGKISAKKFIRFMNDLTKKADRELEKLRLKNFTTKGQIKHVTEQLKQKQQLGESLHPIDFQAVAIENQEILDKIENKNKQLEELKMVTGHYNLKLISHKNKLAEQTIKLNNMKEEISNKQYQMEKLKIQEECLQTEIEDIQKQIENIKKLTDKYHLPDVMEFIQVQTELREMKKTYDRLERHQKIQKTAVSNIKNKRQLYKNELDTKTSNHSQFFEGLRESQIFLN
ncbi:hypothetical protein HCN44_007881 [Aphidius gifuensis]|uniref:Cilia- and flagella-associated protein 263 n=1 Tax=Aphidius gifuensis TaxID=684658 RepID=A0A835CTK4_APHGI|nr:coiled-coil domain-containing protein 113-like [Aphidius gifuensis]KAF7993378.1 hypothetical protein HCN44_007881 [Aphidius gifuensis]